VESCFDNIDAAPFVAALGGGAVIGVDAAGTPSSATYAQRPNATPAKRPTTTPETIKTRGEFIDEDFTGLSLRAACL
jgi:hypothetical protein